MGITPLALVILVLIGLPLGIAAVVYLIVPACKGVSWFVVHVGTFIVREIGDALRVVGGLITALFFVPLILGNVIIGRWSGASHFGRALQAEFKALGASLYRIAIGHPARLLCLGALTEGIERRLPEAMAAAPGADKPPRRVGQFDGYSIVGSLPGGGSGGRLYIAEPSREKLTAFDRAGIADVQQVVIKCFSLRDGSSLPQIVRENRALPAAKRLGLILEHELTDERFFYVMKYVPGESLGLVTQRLHAAGGSDGLGLRELKDAIDYVADLARTLCHYHDGGLWHKDVKPDNIIIAGGQAHLVDFGLITPLRSSMTLTTHGTEYFRDPEMVRMALRGVRVHEVDGAKFDIYAAGAVLYSVVENSFPAHGGLSQISKRCPEALRWIVRRAMADYDKRYPSAAAMLADLEALSAAVDPFAVRPAHLPSFAAADEAAAAPSLHEWEASVPPNVPSTLGSAKVGALGAALPAASATIGAPAAKSPSLRVTSWWTGRYEVSERPTHLRPTVQAAKHSPAPRRPRVAGATAAEQLVRARQRAKTAQARARSRMRGYSAEKFKPINAGVGMAAFAFLAFVAAVVFLIGGQSFRRGISLVQHQLDGTSRVVRIGPGGISIDRTGTPDSEADVAEVTDSSGLAVCIDPAIKLDRRIAAHPGARGSLMILRDPITFESAIRPTIDEQMSLLQQSGFDLRGNHESAAVESEQGETELIAEIRSELGLTPFNSPDARELIHDWLDRYHDLQALIWISRGDDARPAAWIVGRREVAPEVLDAATGVFTPVEGR